jgi:hypothetical protein
MFIPDGCRDEPSVPNGLDANQNHRLSLTELEQGVTAGLFQSQPTNPMNTTSRFLLLAAAALPLTACVDPYYAGGYPPPPVVVGGPPVYVAPQPVYVAPRPVYVAPRPVYVAPRPIYRGGYGHGYYGPRRW